MSSMWPPSRLFYGTTKTVVVAGPHILVIDSKTGQVLRSTTNLSEEAQKHVLKSGVIHTVTVDPSFKYVAEVADDKLLKVWDLEEQDGEGGLKLLNSRELPKKSTGVMFTADSQTILVSDKFGDVFSYPLVYIPFTASELAQQKEDEAKDPYASHSNPSNGTLVLGHASPLNAMLLTSGEKFIVTADRDEHIRVSWYPQGYNVEMYCLGHTKFVSAIHIPSTSPDLLVSGGGDPVLKVWDWMTGHVKTNVDVAAAVEPFIAVKRAPGRWKGEGDDGGEAGASKKEKKGRGSRKEKSNAGSQEMNEQGEGEAMDIDAKPEDLEAKAEKSGPAEKVLAIRKIDSVLGKDGQTTFLFSAIGATALFSFKNPEMGSSSTSISHFDFGCPIVDFVSVAPAAGHDSPAILVTLDPSTRSSKGTHVQDKFKLVAVSEHQVCEPSAEVSSHFAALLSSLNSSATSVPASEADLKGFDLYGELISLPKVVTRGPGLGAAAKEGEEASAEAAETKRAVGRRKRTAKVQEVKTQVMGKDEVEGEPQLKKSKSEDGSQQS